MRFKGSNAEKSGRSLADPWSRLRCHCYGFSSWLGNILEGSGNPFVISSHHSQVGHENSTYVSGLDIGAMSSLQEKLVKRGVQSLYQSGKKTSILWMDLGENLLKVLLFQAWCIADLRGLVLLESAYPPVNQHSYRKWPICRCSTYEKLWFSPPKGSPRLHSPLFFWSSFFSANSFQQLVFSSWIDQPDFRFMANLVYLARYLK